MESKIAEFREAARRETAESLERKALSRPEQALRCREMAKENRAKAGKWRKLSKLPKPEGERVDWHCYQDLGEGIDFLVARSEHSKLASVYLSLVIDHALRGLRALAAHGMQSPAVMLIDRLLVGVRDFEFLAFHRPELFTHYTRRLEVIPATISPTKENAKECEGLMAKLHLGTSSLCLISGSGKQPKGSTPVNGLARRLIGYIEDQQQASIYVNFPELYANWPEWFLALAKRASKK